MAAPRACLIEDCPNPSRTRGWCPKHYMRFRRNGDPLLLVGPQRLELNGKWKGDQIGYHGMHDRVKYARGRASCWACVDCGTIPAREWSYDHLDPDEVTEVTPKGRVVAYSLDISHYQPRCKPCHAKFDLERPTPVTNR